MLAISPDAPADSARLAKDLDLPFPLLSDVDHRVASDYGALAGGGVQPAAFVVNRKAKVVWSYIGDGARDQPSTEQLPEMVGRADSHHPPTFARLLGSWPVWLIALGFMLLAGLAGLADRTLLAWDLPLRDSIRGSFQGAGLEEFLRWTGKLGSRELIGLLTIPAAWIAWSRCRQLAYVLIGAFAAAFALEVVLKATIARPRPPMGIGFGHSFPSGHVLAAAAFWGLLPAWVYLVTGRRWAWAAALAGAGVILLGVGVSRVVLGAHWPSDVVGGYLGGAIFLLIAEWMIHRPVLDCTACPLHPIRHPRVPVRQ